jgi:hypothetical protein
MLKAGLGLEGGTMSEHRCPKPDLYIKDCKCWCYAFMTGTCSQPKLYAIKVSDTGFDLLVFDVRTRSKKCSEKLAGFVVQKFEEEPDLREILESSGHTLVRDVQVHTERKVRKCKTKKRSHTS